MGDGRCDVIGAINDQPCSHQQGQGGIHMVRDFIGTRRSHGKYRVSGVDGDVQGQHLGIGQGHQAAAQRHQDGTALGVGGQHIAYRSEEGR